MRVGVWVRVCLCLSVCEREIEREGDLTATGRKCVEEETIRFERGRERGRNIKVRFV